MTILTRNDRPVNYFQNCFLFHRVVETNKLWTSFTQKSEVLKKYSPKNTFAGADPGFCEGGSSGGS